MIRYTLREWQHLPYGEGAGQIAPHLADRLAAVAASSAFAGSGSGVLEHRRKDLRARGVVGVIAAKGCQLEILPKIESIADHGKADDASLRKRLVHMLAIAQDLRIDPGDLTALDWQKDTLLEILIRLFVRKLTDAVRQGMPRRYLQQEEDLLALRGRLNVVRQYTVLAASPQRLACRYDELSPDVVLNQVMKATILRLSHLSQSAGNQRALRELSFAYADITDVPPAALAWDQITLDRSNERWRDLLKLARLLLDNRHQQTTTGQESGYALLFEMNVLFEVYVARMLRRALAREKSALRVVSQGGFRNCLYEDDIGRFRTKPDIIVYREKQPVLIIDTKWKHLAKRIDDPKQGVSQSDVYQLMAYGRLYECPRVMLLYPHHHDLGNEMIQKDYSIAKSAAVERLQVASIDLGCLQATDFNACFSWLDDLQLPFPGSV